MPSQDMRAEVIRKAEEVRELAHRLCQRFGSADEESETGMRTLGIPDSGREIEISVGKGMAWSFNDPKGIGVSVSEDGTMTPLLLLRDLNTIASILRAAPERIEHHRAAPDTSNSHGDSVTCPPRVTGECAELIEVLGGDDGESIVTTLKTLAQRLESSASSSNPDAETLLFRAICSPLIDGLFEEGRYQDMAELEDIEGIAKNLFCRFGDSSLTVLMEQFSEGSSEREANVATFLTELVPLLWGENVPTVSPQTWEKLRDLAERMNDQNCHPTVREQMEFVRQTLDTRED